MQVWSSIGTQICPASIGSPLSERAHEYTDLVDVTTKPMAEADHCPGYWWSEQMKYYYLIFSDTPRVDYRRLYLSTEGNALRGLRRG